MLTYNINSGTVTSSTLYRYIIILYVVLFILTLYIYRSADYGATFSNINSQLDSSTTHLTLYPQINISPEDYRTVRNLLS